MPEDQSKFGHEHWEKLARQALLEAELTMDPAVKTVLITIANEYLALADKAERERDEDGN